MVSSVRAQSRSLGEGHEEEVLIYYENDAVVKATSSILPPWKPVDGGAAGEVYTSRHRLSTLLLASADMGTPRTGDNLTASTCDLDLGLLGFRVRVDDVERLSVRLGDAYLRAPAGSIIESKDFSSWISFLGNLELEPLDPPLTRSCVETDSMVPTGQRQTQAQTPTPHTARRTRAQAAVTQATGEVTPARPVTTTATIATQRESDDAVDLPAELHFLQLFSSADFVAAQEDSSEHQRSSPLILYAQLLWWLGSTLPAAQSDPRSQLRVHSALLLPRLAHFLGLSISEGSQPSLAAGLADFWRSIQLPHLLSRLTCKPADQRSELIDGVQYNTGTAEDRRRTADKRFPVAMQKMLAEANVEEFALCRSLFGDCELQMQVHCARRLCDLFMPERKKEDLHVLLPELERRLKDRQDALESALAAGASPVEICEMFATELEAHHSTRVPRPLTWGGGVGGGDDPERSNSAAMGGSVRSLTREAIIKAQNHASFVDCWNLIKDRDFTEAPLEILDEVLGSKSLILRRFLQGDESLLHFHPIYARLRMISHELQALFARAQILQPDGGPPASERMRQWEWDESSFKLFFKQSRYEEVDFLSHKTGALGVLALRNVNSIAPVPRDQHYKVISACKLARNFAHTTAVCAGYSAVSNKGMTMYTLFDQLIERLEWSLDMGNQFGPDQTNWMADQFGKALKLAGTLARVKDLCTSPADYSLDEILPWNNPFSRDTAQRIAHVQPLKVLREVMPQLLPAGPPRVLDGVRPQSSGKLAGQQVSGAGQLRPAGKALSAKALGKQPKGPGGGSAAPRTPGPSDNKPGCQAGLIRRLPSGEVAAGGTVFDWASVCKHAGFDPATKCVCVLSNKPGVLRLNVCDKPRHPDHQGLDGPAHQLSSGWDLADITKRFSRPIVAADRAASANASASSSGRQRAVTPGRKRSRQP